MTQVFQVGDRINDTRTNIPERKKKGVVTAASLSKDLPPIHQIQVKFDGDDPTIHPYMVANDFWIRISEYWILEPPVAYQTPPLGAFCSDCNDFNAYVPAPYTCYGCKQWMNL